MSFKQNLMLKQKLLEKREFKYKFYFEIWSESQFSIMVRLYK